MKFELIKLKSLSGKQASIYTIRIENDQHTFFERFLLECKVSYINETKDIVNRLKVIGTQTGAREQFFKINEGKPGDGVCALYDDPDKELRLYCIRYGTQLIVLGSGGPKPKNIRALQENEKLTEENYFLRWLSEMITERIKSKEIRFINNGLDFSGDLTFEEDEE